jgi:hypothetical protein
MGRMGRWLAIATLLVLAAGKVLAAPFVLFPKAGELRSPDGRFVVRNKEREASEMDLVGTSHSLWLIDVSRNRARKLCDYLGVAAVAWSDNEYVIMTEYVARRTSRAWIFPVSEFREALVFDKTALVHMLPVQLRETLRANDHVFVEASGVEAGTVRLNVWGYGEHDARGFRWICDYDLREGVLACRERPASH